MTPEEHLAWINESVDRLLAIPADAVDTPVPRCPGWTIGALLDHLGRGLGRGYTAMVTSKPTDEPGETFGAALGTPTEGADAHATFAREIPRMLEAMAAADPWQACATYVGPGTTWFWRRMAALELYLHGRDAAEALGQPFSITEDRAAEGVVWTTEFFLPIGLRVLDMGPPASIFVEATGTHLGENMPVATIADTSERTLLALWGRGEATIEGDEDAALGWMEIIPAAF